MTDRSVEPSSHPSSSLPTDPHGGLEIIEELTEDVAPGTSLAVPLRDPTDKQRYLLAIVLLAVTVALSVGLAVLAVTMPDDRWTRFEGLTPLVLAPFQTLLGAAIGWYFGGRGK